MSALAAVTAFTAACAFAVLANCALVAWERRRGR